MAILSHPPADVSMLESCGRSDKFVSVKEIAAALEKTLPFSGAAVPPEIVVYSLSGEVVCEGSRRKLRTSGAIRSACARARPEMNARQIKLITEEGRPIPQGSMEKVYTHYFHLQSRNQLVLTAVVCQALRGYPSVLQREIVHVEDVEAGELEERLRDAVPEAEPKAAELRETLVEASQSLAAAPGAGPCTVVILSSGVSKRKDVALPLCDDGKQEVSKFCKLLERNVRRGRLTKDLFFKITLKAWATGGTIWTLDVLKEYAAECGAESGDDDEKELHELMVCLVEKCKGAVVFSSRKTLMAAGVRLGFQDCAFELFSPDDTVPSSPELQEAAKAVAWIQGLDSVAVVFERAPDALHAILPCRPVWIDALRLNLPAASAP